MLINSIFGKTFKQNNEKTFKAVNELAKDVFGSEPILMEDLWFWGRFYVCKEDAGKKASLIAGSFAGLLYASTIFQIHTINPPNTVKQEAIKPRNIKIPLPTSPLMI